MNGFQQEQSSYEDHDWYPEMDIGEHARQPISRNAIFFRPLHVSLPRETRQTILLEQIWNRAPNLNSAQSRASQEGYAETSKRV